MIHWLTLRARWALPPTCSVGALTLCFNLPVFAQQLVVNNTTVTTADRTLTSRNQAGRDSSAIYVTGASANLTGTNLNATSTVNSASALAALSGGTAELTGGSLTVQGGSDTSYAALARDAGTSVTLNNVRVSSNLSTAVVANLAGSITMKGGAISLTQSSGTAVAVGLFAQGNLRVSADGTSITTTGANLRGASSQSSFMQLSNLSISVNGVQSFGIYADRLNAGGPAGDVLTGTGLVVRTVGSQSNGVRVITGASATFRDLDVGTQGDDATGVHAGLGATVNVTGKLAITTTGARAYGASANGVLDGGGPAALNMDATGTIATSGLQAHGILARAGGVATVNGVTVTTQGVNAAALAARESTMSVNNATLSSAQGVGALVVGNSSVSLARSQLTSSGHGISVAATSGLINAPDPEIPDGSTQPVTPGAVAPATRNTVVVQGGRINAGGDLVRVDSTNADITMSSGLQAATATGRLLNVVSTGSARSNVNLTLDAVTLSGDIVADSNSTVQGYLRNGTVLTGKIDPVSLDIDGTSRWNMSANSQLGNLNMASGALVQFQPPVAGVFKTLMVQGALAGNGTIALNTVLASDGAASDKVVISGGTASGATALRIANAGGTGALTTANGIQVVDAVSGGTTAAGSFVLDGRAVAGPYEYRLFRGSTDGSNADAWYLRSEQTPVPPVPPTPPDPPRPLYRPEIAAYLANQHLAGEMFVHSLHDRLGEPQYLEGQGFNAGQDKPRSGWLRVVGNWQGSKSADGVFKASTNSFLLHGGAELAKWQVFGGADRAHAGLMGIYGYANTNATAQGNPFTAKGTVEGWSAGAYGTWYQNDERKLGAYVDTWFQYGWFTNHVDGQYLPSVRYNAQGWAVSGETGYAVPMRNDWVAEPQGQVIYVGYNESDITEPNGTRVTGANSHGWITRLGARFHRTFLRQDDRKLQPYVTLNWWHTSVSSNISFNDLPLGSMYPQNRYELKLGLNADLGKRWTGWTNVSGAWGAQSFYQYAVRAGIKYAW